MTKVLKVLSLLLVVIIAKAEAQHYGYNSPTQIDSVIVVKAIAYSKESHTHPFVLDGPGTDSEFTRYKKVIGVKIRVAKGLSQGGDIMLNKEPFYYYATYVITKNSFFIKEYDTVYFIDKKPVKFVEIVRKEYKNEEKHILQHNKIFYFDNDVVVESEIDGKAITLNRKQLTHLLNYIHGRTKDMLADLPKK